MKFDSNIADSYDRNLKDDYHYSQPGILFRKVMTERQRMNTVSNFVCSMKGVSGPKKKEIITRQLNHFYKADKELAKSVAKGLVIKYSPGGKK